MPNWCNNVIEIGGDEEQIVAFEKFLEENKGKNWFDFFLPLPESEKENWYEWAVNNWGCKWNCDAIDWVREDSVIKFSFDSPWGPPIALYEFLTGEGFDIESHYLEEGVGFVGRFLDGIDENYNYDLSEEDSLDYIPDEIVDFWDLRTQQEDYLAENTEEDEDE